MFRWLWHGLFGGDKQPDPPPEMPPGSEADEQAAAKRRILDQAERMRGRHWSNERTVAYPGFDPVATRGQLNRGWR